MGVGIRPLRVGDLPAVKSAIDATGLFPSEMLDAMTAGYLAGTDDASIWQIDGGEHPIAVAYCAPERMTQGTWNLLLIAVHPAWQRQGRGAALIRHIEALLVAREARLLLVETSGLPEFAQTRAFYPRCGFVEAARIADFYQPGEDKVVFRKIPQRQAGA